MKIGTYPEARILILDEDEVRAQKLGSLLTNSGFKNIAYQTSREQGLDAYLCTDPDLVVFALREEDPDGLEFLGELTNLLSRRVYVPILAVADYYSQKVKEDSLEAGAMDFMTRPFDVTETILRINNLLHTRQLHLNLERDNQNLESRVYERTKELELAYSEVLERLALASEYRDDDTGLHTERVAALSTAIGLKMGLLDTDSELIGKAALLHDVGKIGIPDEILLKPTTLTTEEMFTMQKHVEIGSALLSNSKSKLLRLAEIIARTHHEKWNGNGYIGLTGEEIPLPGRIVAVADVFDSLVSRRPYREPWLVGDAIAEIRHQSGAHFDPDVVDAFLLVALEGFPEPYSLLFEEDPKLCDSVFTSSYAT
ncbi:hypothetical protein BH11ARM1_BH11ARM1_17160 [soil metagenome]